MENLIIVLILLALVIGVVCFLVNAKKKGEKCIGCPYAKQCNKNCNAK